MPHATGQHDPAHDEDDDVAIGRILNPGDPSDLEHLGDLNRDLVPGDKADDAVDYEDFGDDDLPDDEDVDDPQGAPVAQSSQSGAAASLDAFMREGNLPAYTTQDGGDDDGMDDLFGDDLSSPMYMTEDVGQIKAGLLEADDIFGHSSEQPHAESKPRSASSPQEPWDARGQSSISDAPQSRDHQIQMNLFSMSKYTSLKHGQDSLPAPPENQEELLASLWPKFRRDATPKFVDLLPPKKARYVGKTIPKPPKPVNPTKISLELAHDQEKSFKIWPASNKRGHEDTEHIGVIWVEQDAINECRDEEDIDMDSDFENEPVGGVSWEDLQIVCEDWDVQSEHESVGSNRAEYHDSRSGVRSALGDMNHEGDQEFGYPAAKVCVKV